MFKLIYGNKRDPQGLQKEQMSVFGLAGKVGLVTGGGSGIGEEICVAFAENGARVVVADIDLDAAKKVANQIGNGSIAVALDVTNPESVHAGFSSAMDIVGGLDVLVNNAGIGFVGSVEDTELPDFERLMSVNVRGVYLCVRAAIPFFRKRGNGNIINIGSVAGLVGIEKRFAYCATKGAVVSMSRQLAVEYVTENIRVNCICPGTVHTPFVEGYLQKFHSHEIEETRAKLHARQPMGRMGRPDEIAGLAVYLASDASAFMTGSIVSIDGGWTAK